MSRPSPQGSPDGDGTVIRTVGSMPLSPYTHECQALGWDAVEASIPPELWRRLSRARQRVNEVTEKFVAGHVADEDLILVREALEALAEKAIELLRSGGAGWSGRAP